MMRKTPGILPGVFRVHEKTAAVISCGFLHYNNRLPESGFFRQVIGMTPLAFRKKKRMDEKEI